MRIYSFPPVVGPDPTLLILGSMPGKRSLDMRQYYAHPRNSFWHILGNLCGFDPQLNYPLRLERLVASGIALWDSLQGCERPGSLDSSILPLSEVPNDIPRLLSTHPTIRAIAFNGGKSWQAFKRHILPLIPNLDVERLTLLPLPSTSPANARLSTAQKLAIWSSSLSPFLRVK